VRIGAPDESLTAVSGMAAVSELCQRLGVVQALDTAVGSIKVRARGRSAGGLLVGLAAAQLAGQDHLVGLDRLCADGAGQALVPVAGLGSRTAAGLARRISPEQWAAVETGVATVTARMLERLPPGGRQAMLRSVTIDLDTTDVEVYGRKKRGVANYQGQRVGRPHVASWAELEVMLAADLLAGDQDPRPGAPGAAAPCAARAAHGGGPGDAARGWRVLRGGSGGRRASGRGRVRDRRQTHRPTVAHPGRDQRLRLCRGDRHARRSGRRRGLSPALVAGHHRAAHPPGSAGP